jgi:hypothetical protein
MKKELLSVLKRQFGASDTKILNDLIFVNDENREITLVRVFKSYRQLQGFKMITTGLYEITKFQEYIIQLFAECNRYNLKILNNDDFNNIKNVEIDENISEKILKTCFNNIELGKKYITDDYLNELKTNVGIILHPKTFYRHLAYYCKTKGIEWRRIRLKGKRGFHIFEEFDTPF